MSWTLALIASSVALAGGQYVMARQQAIAGQQRAKIEGAQKAIDAEVASLQALQQEASRKEELEEILATNNAGVGYDPLTSPSFLAIEKSNYDEFERDAKNIQLMGRMNYDRAQAGAQISNIEASSYKIAGRYAWLQPAGTLLQGATNAKLISMG